MPPATRQRLIVCLDGTWNNQDDSTNVLHHFSLVTEGRVVSDAGGEFIQKKHYVLGVGTGVLDRVTGGGFGFGLEGNVRAGYNWLVQHYHGEYADGKSDEIYIFGFSRGAYTARSLVGFIGCCGLLRRGAPLTVFQLWTAYCLLGRKKEERDGGWERVFGESDPGMRPLNRLVIDPWLTQPRDRGPGHSAGPDGPPRDPVFWPDIGWDKLNATECLLVRWSRRVPVTFLGVYDTVGAMGFDALAIPGLTSKLALHHNMRPTSLIQHCRHALAIDEHRSGFSHTPLRAFIPHATGEEWETNRARWAARIEQRWFVGAHSNIGGGYENNELAQRPFAWMLEGARQAGLVCETPPAFPPAKPEALPRDSYVEFATPFWSSLFRSKRYYRAVDPEPEFRASRRKERGRQRGFSLVPINEVIDSTAFAFWSRPGITPPPQVVAYARRRHDDPATPPALREQLRKLADPAQTPPNPWLGDEMLPHAIVVFWAAFAAAGVVTLAHVVTVGEWRAPMWLLALAAFSLVIVDRVESRMNFMLALGAASARTRAYYDGIYWTRALGVILFFAGVLGAARHLWMAGWRIPTPDLLDDRLLSLLFKWWPVAAAAAAGGIAANALDGGRGAGRRMAGALLGAAGTVALAGLMLALAWCGARMVAPVFGSSPADPLPPPTHAGLAGFLLLLQFALGWLLGGLAWVSEPLARANLGSINMLQRCASPAAVAGLFRNWIELLSRPWVRPDEKAAGQVRQRISETLWRDIHGYIPTYLVVLHFGLWFASGKLGWKWLLETSGGVWFMLPTIAAAANVIEDAFYVWFANYHTSSPAEQAARRAPNAAHTLVAFAMTWVKNVAFAAAVLLSAAAILHGSWLIVHLHEATGWRGTVALAVTIVTLVAGVALAVGAVYYRWVTAHKIRREPRDRHAPA